MSVRVVDINSVKITPGREPNHLDIHGTISILEKQGLIAPLAVDLKGNIGRLDHWDPARLEAAKELGWETVIVTHPMSRREYDS